VCVFERERFGLICMVLGIGFVPGAAGDTADDVILVIGCYFGNWGF
jgi:hypothetical protein